MVWDNSKLSGPTKKAWATYNILFLKCSTGRRPGNLGAVDFLPERIGCTATLELPLSLSHARENGVCGVGIRGYPYITSY